MKVHKDATNALWALRLDEQGLHTDFTSELIIRASESKKLVPGGLYPCPHCGIRNLVVRDAKGNLCTDCRCEYRTPGPAKSGKIGGIS